MEAGRLARHVEPHRVAGLAGPAQRRWRRRGGRTSTPGRAAACLVSSGAVSSTPPSNHARPAERGTGTAVRGSPRRVPEVAPPLVAVPAARLAPGRIVGWT